MKQKKDAPANEQETGKDLFQDLEPSARKNALDDQAYKVEKRKVKFPFTADELTRFREQVSEKMISISDEEAKFDELKTLHKAVIEPVKKEVKSILGDIRAQGYFKEDTVYMLADYSQRIMNYYTSEGKFIESRPLLTSERTLLSNENVHQLGNTGS